MIARTAFEQILKEYDEKQLKAARDLRERREQIERLVPELKEIEDGIAGLSVSEAISRISGKTLPGSYQEQLASLKKEKAEVLARSGFSEYDLSAHYECNKCQDTGYVGNELCSCFKERVTDILYDQSNLKEILKEENFGTHSFRYYEEGAPLDAAQDAMQKARDFIDNFDSTDSNLFITGAAGVGKTFLSNCIAKELLDAGYFVVYLSAIRLFDILSDVTFGSYRTGSEGASSEFVKKHIYDCDLLIIDDLGTEMVNSFTSTQLFNCVNERILSKKHTIISTNLSLKQLQENYSERIFSRIANKYTFIRLLGNDIRMMKKLEEN